METFPILLVLLKVITITSVKLDFINCGVDHSSDVSEGRIKISEYPWLGILYYPYWGANGETRSITTVALIHKEFVIGAAAEIGPMPKNNFRRKTRVLLGEDWEHPGRRVRNYILHPEYGETYNTIALVQLKDIVRDVKLPPLCPPPNTILRNPAFYVFKFKEDFHSLDKEVLRVMHVPAKLCKDFYVAANLYSAMMRPPHVACAATLTKEVCVWNAGAALVVRDVWGRWQLLGVGVRGPGCGAPSRYLDMMSYLPWLEKSLEQFQMLTITKLNNHNYVVRAGGDMMTQRFGACDEEEKVNLIYREQINLKTDHMTAQFLVYNMTIFDEVDYTCLTLKLQGASSHSAMSIKHVAHRAKGGKLCYQHRISVAQISVTIQFFEGCVFEMAAWGFHRNMSTIDVQQWKWNEGSYYEDFWMQPVEYRGTHEMTDYGFEPLDKTMWIPEYDIWTTTEVNNYTTMTSPPYFLPEMRKYRPSTYRRHNMTFARKQIKKSPRRKTTSTSATTELPTTSSELPTTTSEFPSTTGFTKLVRTFDYQY